MPNKKQKFYVVWKGYKPGIYLTWEECKAQTNGFSKAKFKSFKTLEEAKKAYGQKKSSKKTKLKKQVDTEKSHTTTTQKESPKQTKPPKPKNVKVKEKIPIIGDHPIEDSYCVDAACSGNPGPLEYQGVYNKTKERIFKQGPFKNGTNNIGEFLALVHGLAWLKNKGISKPIYSDSTIAIGWVQKKHCKTKFKNDESTEHLFELIGRAEKWLKENSYNNKILKWETKAWGEIPADFGRK